MLTSITNSDPEAYYFPQSTPGDHSMTDMDRLEYAATVFVKKIGVRPNLFGYRLLVSAIIESVKQSGTFSTLSGCIYPVVAEKYGCTIQTVERNIRRAIDSAYEYDPDRLSSVLYFNTGKPFVSEVISIAVETIKYKI